MSVMLLGVTQQLLRKDITNRLSLLSVAEVLCNSHSVLIERLRLRVKFSAC